VGYLTSTVEVYQGPRRYHCDRCVEVCPGDDRPIEDAMAGRRLGGIGLGSRWSPIRCTWSHRSASAAASTRARLSRAPSTSKGSAGERPPASRSNSVACGLVAHVGSDPVHQDRLRRKVRPRRAWCCASVAAVAACLERWLCDGRRYRIHLPIRTPKSKARAKPIMLRRPSRPKRVIDRIAKAASIHRSVGHERGVGRHRHGDRFRQ
jgi:hypothetical protein